MGALGLSVQVSRVTLGLPPLEINDGVSYRIPTDGVGPGPMVMRRETVSSPVVAGRLLLSAVPDVQTPTIKVRVLGSTHAQLDTRIGVLIAAFQQWDYSLSINLGGAQRAWSCEPADVAVGTAGQWDEAGLRSLQQVITLTVPRSPLAINGTY